MSNYYIRIDDDESVDMANGIRFKYNGTETESDFIVVDENQYSTLVQQFNEFSSDVSRIVNYNLQPLLQSSSIGYSSMSGSIVDESRENPISYDDLSNMLSSYATRSSIESINENLSEITSSINNIEIELSNLQTNKASTSELNSLKNSITDSLKNYYSKSEINSLLNNKANSSHTHNWTNKKINDYCNLAYNDQLKLASFRYFRKGYNLNTSPKTIHSGIIPSAYRPKRVAWLSSHNVHYEAKIDSTGDFVIAAESGYTGKNKTISVYGMWQYGA